MLDSPKKQRRVNAGKGRQTRSTILGAAIAQAAAKGLEGLTIGSLAELTGMSKSGLFAHFGSREELQLAVLKAYEERFAAAVLMPALEAPRGLGRLRRIFQLWVEHTADTSESGCILMSAASEYDDQPGPLRDALVAMVLRWQAELARATGQAVERGDLRADLDVPAFIFDVYGIMLALHHDARLLHSPNSTARAAASFERLLGHAGGERHGLTPQTANDRALAPPAGGASSSD
ncbi:MAG: TetR/AcrR family transcriptional regulator [Burkholderiaceae bacterium]